MTSPRSPSLLTLSIAAVERDTGLSKDTLRAWERRYGFPQPTRDGVGERAYPLEQVQRLRLLKRLLDAGHRPGRVVPLDAQALAALEGALPAAAAGDVGVPAVTQTLDSGLQALREHDVPGLRRLLQRELLRLGLQRFLLEVLSPMNAAVGEAWLQGRLEIFEEHAYTELAQVVLRQAIAALPPAVPGTRPRVLLATVPGEPHGLGLLMTEALLALHGADCVSLGVQTPVWDVVRAAQAFGSDIVALGFTGCTAPHQIVDALRELRAKLPPGVDVWAGGAAPVLQRRPIDGVAVVPVLDRLPPTLQTWRSRAGGLGPAGPALLESGD